MSVPGFHIERDRFFPATDLSRDTLLVVPDLWREAEAVTRLQKTIGEVGGSAPQVLAQRDFEERMFEDAQVVACGSLADNSAIQRLYVSRRCFADSFFPGKDGYFIKSISDPFGYGKNCITVCASTGEGLAAALPVLEDRIRTEGPQLGRLHEARFDHELPPLPSESELETLVREDLERWGSGWNASPFRGGHLQSCMWHYYLTDHPVWGLAAPRIFAGSIEPWRAERRDYPESYHCLFHLHTYFQLWDLIEDSPLYTPEDRRNVVTMFGDLLHHLQGLFYMREDVNPAGEIRQNHTTFIGLNLAVGQDYMRRRYGIRTFDGAKDVARRIFEGQADCYKPNDDGGVGYTWHVPQETLYYYLYHNDYRYIDDGHVADLCRLAVVTTDNMRSETNYGDTAGYSAFQGGRWDGRLWPLMVSTWRTGDPRHLWTLNWLGEGKRPPLSRTLAGLYCAVQENGRGFMLDGRSPEPPDELLGIYAMDMPQPVLDWVRRHVPEGYHPDPEKTYFDKLSLRRNFEPEGEYLLLEGLGTTCHGHEDTNAIIRLTWNNRAWLGDGDYIRAAPHYHSSIVVQRDGLGVLDPPGDGVVIPPLASLEQEHDAGEVALVRSCAAGYNGVDWRRNLFWKKGRYFTVIDQLHCEKAGQYDLRCLWRVVGDPTLDGNSVQLRQQGETFYIRNADGADLETVPDLHPKSRWRAYPYAGDVLTVLHQKSGGALQPGESFAFLNLLTPHPEICIERLDELLVRVTDTDEVSVLGVGRNRLGDVDVEGDMFCLSLSGNTLRLAGVNRLGAEEYGGRTQSLDVEKDETAHQIAAAIRETTGRERTKKTTETPAYPEGRLKPVWQQETGGGISDLCVQDQTILCGGPEGRVSLIALEDGSTHWSADAGAGVGRVLLGDLDGDGQAEAIAGNADSELVVLNGRDGAEVWRRELKNMSSRGGQVTALALADLEGEGRTSLLAGTAGWFVNAFAPDGSRKWAEWFRYHAITDFRVADADGDGRAEVMVGTEYSTPLTVHNFDGSFRWSTFEEVGSEGNASTGRRGIQLNRMALLDVDHDGVQEILYGTGDGWMYAVKPQDGEACWHLNITGEVTGLAAGPQGVYAANEYGDLYRLDLAGKITWRVRACRGIREIVAVEDHIVVAGESGRLVLFNPDGVCEGSTSLEREIVCLRPHDKGVVAGLANHGLVRVDID